MGTSARNGFGGGFHLVHAKRSHRVGRSGGCWQRGCARWRWWSLALPACSWFGKDDVIPDDPADKLYNEGLFLLNNKKDYKAAAKKFEEVDRQHPYSEWARKALIMSAYAYYEGTRIRRTRSRRRSAT